MVSNRQLLLPYAVPYLAYVGIASLLGPHVSDTVNYLLRIIAVSLLLIWAWRWYCPLRGPHSSLISVLTGVAAGLAGLVLWLVLLTPFVDADDATAWSSTAFVLRLLSAGILVPVFEELLMRGFLFRLALQWDIERKNKEKDPLLTALDHRSANDVTPGQWSWMAVALSTLAFMAGHQVYEWPAAVAYGLLMAALWIYRKDLIVCITAHATTNIGLACYVYLTGTWQYW
jgi:uncharacterized protein